VQHSAGRIGGHRQEKGVPALVSSAAHRWPRRRACRQLLEADVADALEVVGPHDARHPHLAQHELARTQCALGNGVPPEPGRDGDAPWQVRFSRGDCRQLRQRGLGAGAPRLRPCKGHDCLCKQGTSCTCRTFFFPFLRVPAPALASLTFGLSIVAPDMEGKALSTPPPSASPCTPQRLHAVLHALPKLRAGASTGPLLSM
jgi:hypothetical protein